MIATVALSVLLWQQITFRTCDHGVCVPTAFVTRTVSQWDTLDECEAQKRALETWWTEVQQDECRTPEAEGRLCGIQYHFRDISTFWCAPSAKDTTETRP